MSRRVRVWAAILLALALGAPVAVVAPAGADIAPPWCGTPEPDAAENLPDGTDPGDPPGSFPHIPVYAIGCTLESIEAESNGRMTVEVIGQSARGRDMYFVTLNSLETQAQRDAFDGYRKVRRHALSDPARSQDLLESEGEVKVPVFIQSGIHGNEYEGVDAAMRVIEELATTPYGTDPEIDAILDHTILLFNVTQNPDGRIAGVRTNGNGFDLNRDYVTQSQSETRASVGVFTEWLPTETLDLHGYVTPTLIDATTVPHNPGIEYDIFLKWNQQRIDANEAELATEGFGITRPVNNIPDGWIPEGETLPQGWDDWGPFYTAVYGQLVGVDASTVEMCNRQDAACGIGGVPPAAPGRFGALRTQELAVWSTLDFVVGNRHDMLFDQFEIYRRGVEDEARVDLTDPLPVIGTAADHDYMTEYPRAHVIPVGEGQRSDAEAERLVDFLLANNIAVEGLTSDYNFEGRLFKRGSYVVWMDQALRGLANTMLSVGDDISDRVTQLYAPPGAWTNGFLWGADVVTIPGEGAFAPSSSPIRQARDTMGGLRSGPAVAYALRVDSPTAVKTVNSLADSGVPADLATETFSSTSAGQLPAGSVIFAADDKVQLRAAGRSAGVWFEALAEIPVTEPIDGVPRIACLCSELENWALGQLGFTSDRWTNGTINSAPSDPLVDYDVIYNTAQNYPSDTPGNATVRARYAAFFAAGGGYVGARTNGGNFFVNSGVGEYPTMAMESQGTNVSGGRNAQRLRELLSFMADPTPVSQGDVSGVVVWDNEAGVESPIVGAYPAQDTGLVETPVWYTDVPAELTIDGRLPEAGFLASGHWPDPDPSAAGSAVILHGPNSNNSARVTLFGIDPIFRAHPERSFPAVAGAVYWTDM